MQNTSLRQRHDLGQIIEAAYNVYTQHFMVLFSIAAVVIPLGIVSGIVQTSIKNQALELSLLGAVSLVQFVVNIFVGGALITALADIADGRSPDFSRSYDNAVEQFSTLLLAGLRAAFHIVLFAITIVGIPWAIQRAVRWVFVEQAVLLENVDAKSSLSRSAEVVLGNWWRTAGILIAISLVAAVPSGIIAAVASFTPPAVGSTTNAVVNALLLPFVITGITLLYFDLKARKESDATVSPP